LWNKNVKFENLKIEKKNKKDRKMENKDILSRWVLKFQIFSLFPICHSFWWMITYRLNFIGGVL